MRKYLFVIVCGCMLAACLDETPRDQILEENTFNSATNLYLNTVATLYNYIGGSSDSQGLQGTYRGVYDFNTFTTDEAMIPTRGGDWYDGGFWQGLFLHDWGVADGALNDTWNYLYKVIVLCNSSLARLAEHQSMLTAEELKAYQSEVRAIRAMYYYYLMDMFARVPLVVSEDVSMSDVQQSRRSEIFDFTFKELQEAVPYLPDQRSNMEGDYYGRVTRPVAYFLLAKLALNAEVYKNDDWTNSSHRIDGKQLRFAVDGENLNAWETAIAYCDKLEAFGYTLEDDYTSNFAIHNENSKENIFTIPMDKMVYSNQFQYLFRSRHYNHGSAIGLGAENGACATIEAVGTYGYASEKEDKRYTYNYYSGVVRDLNGNVIYMDNKQPLEYMPLAVTSLDLSGTAYEKTAGARMKKYEVDKTAFLDGKLQENDIVLFRFGDVLLMRSEAKVRNGESGDDDLNSIRARVGSPARKATLQNLLAERMMELAWEGWRRQDLVRFGCYTQAYTCRPQLVGEDNGYTTVFPIPGDALSLNKNLTQNPGY